MEEKLTCSTASNGVVKIFIHLWACSDKSPISCYHLHGERLIRSQAV